MISRGSPSFTSPTRLRPPRIPSPLASEAWLSGRPEARSQWKAESIDRSKLILTLDQRVWWGCLSPHCFGAAVPPSTSWYMDKLGEDKIR